MKRVKYIALVLVLCLGLMGGAYAAWTADQNINTTVSTGNLEMTYVDSAIWAPGVGNGQLGQVGTAKTSWLTGSHKKSGDTVTYTIGNLYPGVNPSLAMACKNTGTVPVKLANVEVTLNPASSGIWDYLKAEVRYRYKAAENDWPQATPDIESGLAKDLGELISDVVGDQVFKPGDEIHFGTFGEKAEWGSIIVWLDENTPEQYQGRENIKFDVKMTWQQANLS